MKSEFEAIAEDDVHDGSLGKTFSARSMKSWDVNLGCGKCPAVRALATNHHGIQIQCINVWVVEIWGAIPQKLHFFGVFCWS